jgi:hypothetical protein
VYFRERVSDVTNVNIPATGIPILGYRTHKIVERGSVVVIATRNGMIGPGIESRWGRGFLHPSRVSLGLSQPLYGGCRFSLPGINPPGPSVDHPPTFKTKVKERVELYMYSPSGCLWPVIGQTLRLPLALPLVKGKGKGFPVQA